MQRQIILMDKERIQRSIKRLAIQVWENLGEDELIIVGLNERGYATANMLVDALHEILGTKSLQVHKYDVKNLTHNKPLPVCTEKRVLIIDDVIFSGKTMFEAVSAIISTGNPSKVEVLTLVDRGHRAYPIQSNLTGMNIPTKFGEHIEVMLQSERLEQVVLFKNN
ncbi:phosphoribosyltransferase family protein [Balneola vulgaris]|uniref:phosphoribosyltransferase family protein n=1 Tax=Balneola vulgaris TaxID=287535 RepID=UPI001F09A31A|nr:phosphoribosyltransferase family protein [Balneola vulgaris]